MTRPRQVNSALAPLATLLAGARLALAVPVGYLTVLTGAAWIATALGRKVRPPARQGALRFDILVPAHDEEVVIGATVHALQSLDYAAELYRVHVVADHCTDSTVEIARAAGAIVHEHVGERRGKGPALEWAIGRVVDRSGPSVADVLVIVDADTIVAESMLRELAAVMTNGAQVVQAQYRVRDPGSSAAAGLRAAALASRHHVRPLGRNALGASSGLYGNGMAFRSDLLRRRAWTNHLTEDIEFQMELLLDGILVRYAPAAVVEAQMPATLEGATTQNERWERGRLELARRYVPRLLRSATTRRSGHRVAAVDAVLDHLVPPLSVLGAAVVGVTTASTVVSVARGRRAAGLGLPVALAAHVLSSLVLAGAPASVYRSLLQAPTMVVWKVRLWVRMLARRHGGEWIRTARRDGSNSG